MGVWVLGCASPLFGAEGMFDMDGDRYGNVVDCDDFNADVNPGAGEACDDAGVDEDCDRRVNDKDDDLRDPATWYLDADGDGFGGQDTMLGCAPADGFVEAGGDCDDADPSVNPGTDEVCDEDHRDEDCDGLADDDDDDATDLIEAYYDKDGDRFGDPARSARYCSLPDDWVDQAGDCDDDRASINPNA
jgi:hypothetical protein